MWEWHGYRVAGSNVNCDMAITVEIETKFAIEKQIDQKKKRAKKRSLGDSMCEVTESKQTQTALSHTDRIAH